MGRYFLNEWNLTVTPALPNDIEIMASITKTNKEFTIEQNIERKFIVVAKIKPKDGLFSGIKWEEEK